MRKEISGLKGEQLDKILLSKALEIEKNNTLNNSILLVFSESYFYKKELLPIRSLGYSPF